MKNVAVIAIALLFAACQGGQQTSSPRDDGIAPSSSLLAGAAKRVVTPSQSQVDGEEEARIGGLTTVQNFHLGGFGIGPLQSLPDPLNVDITVPAGGRFHTNEAGMEEHTWLRVLILQDTSSDTSIAFVTLDAVGAGNIIQANLKTVVSEATGIAVDNILFGQTHTHAGADLQGLWGGVPASWVQQLYLEAVAAATEAMQALQPATLAFGQLEAPEFNNYRRPRVFRDAEADTTASLLKVRAEASDETIASLLQFNAHPTSVGTGNDPRVPHADYPLGAEDYLEQDGGIALYYNGPIADASGSGGSCDGDDYARVRCRGEELAAFTGTADLMPLNGTISARHAEAILPVTNPLFVGTALLGSFNRYYNFAELPVDQIPGLGSEANNLPQLAPVAFTTVSRITIGDALEIVTIPGEATNTFGEYIKSLVPEGRRNMLLGLTHNSFGYILPEEEFNYIDETGDDGFVLPFTGYEEFVSLGPLTAPLLRMQAYNPLFDAAPEANVPPTIAACNDASAPAPCIIDVLVTRLDYIQRAYAQACRENLGEDNPFCALIDPDTNGFQNVSPLN